MKYRALATDYDGTLACDGRVDEPTLRALERARARGLRLVLVTGRELTDLANAFARLDLFDRVVAENGAVLLEPSTSTVRVLGPAPPPAFLDRLTRRHVPVFAGRCIVATFEPYHAEMLAIIRELDLAWHIILNKEAVMALPSGITKASGLLPALEELGVEAAHTAGIGDAENDSALLESCGLAAAVANALPSVKELAHVVTVAERGAGVAELIEQLLAE
jgi:hydroxymethylpyrimidine pyrophosphatase-like HAD family hydrolase